MGLIAHYPLNGNADDVLSRYNGTASNVTWVDGKLGQAGKGANDTALNSGLIDSNEMPQLLSELSVSFWIKPPTTIPFAWKSIIRRLTNDSNNQLNFRYTSDGNNIQYYHGDDSTPYVITTNREALMPSGEWTHITLVRSITKGLQQIYKNGVLYISRNPTNSPKTVTAPFRIEFAYDQLLQDVRVYDHALSKREIRDLCQGKVIDFPFNKPVSTTTNLISDPLLKNGLWTGRWGSPTVAITGTYLGAPVIRVTATSNQTSGFVTPYEFFVDAGETVTVSMDVRSNDVTNLNYIYLMRSGFSNSQFSAVSVSPSFTRVSATMTNTTAATCAVLIARNTLSTGQWFEVARVQVEKKPFATEFVEGSRDGRLFGVYPNTTPTVLDETVHPEPLDDGYRFDQNSFINIGNLGNFTEFSFSFWCYPYALNINANNNYRRLLSHSGHGGSFIIIEQGGSISFRVPSVNGANFTSESGLVQVGAWSHITCVYDGQFRRIFHNGVQVASQDIGSGVSQINNLQISDNTSQFFDGVISNVKGYATALSADEVKELYQQRASLDAQGNFYSSLINSSIGYQKVWGDGTGIGFTIEGGIDGTSVSTNGILRFTTNTTDPRIRMYNIGSFDPNVYKFIQVKYRIVSGNAGNVEIFFTNTQYTAANGAQVRTAPLNSDGNWNVVTVVMYTHANWTNSNITGWRFDMGTVSGVTTEVEWIRLVSDTGALSVKSNKAVGDFSEVGITNGLAAYYPLRTSAKDFSGNGYDGISTGAIPVGGGFDGRGAYNFPPSENCRIAVESDILDDVELDSFSVTAWVKPESHNNDWRYIYHRSSGTSGIIGGAISMLAISSANQFTASVNGTNYATSTDPVIVGQIYFLSVVYSDGVLKLFVNGEEKASRSVNITMNRTGKWAIGSAYYGGLGHRDFLGDIFNVKIFNRALSPEEIAVEYKRTGVTKMTQHQGTTYIQGEFKEI